MFTPLRRRPLLLQFSLKWPLVQLLGDFFVVVILHVLVIWALVHSHRSTVGRGGSEPGLPEPAVISAVSAHIVTKCPVELTDVKIHLDANHAANRSAGLPAARNGLGRPRCSE